MLAAADRVGGRAGMVVLSIVGTVAAALLSALLARRIDPGLAVPALWAVGVASPLLFDGYVVIAHTLGAACAAGAALLLLRQLDERRSWIALGGAAVLLVVGMLLRTEMLFMGFALGAAVAIVGITRRSRGTVLMGLVPAAAVAVGFGLDRLFQGLILQGGGATTSAVAGESGGLITGRIIAFGITWLLPSLSADGAAALVLVVAAMAVVAVVLARRTPPERDGVRLFAVVAAVAAVARLAFGGSAVPGLLVAFPLFVAGLAALRRDTFAGMPARFLGASFGLFAAGVLATQYATRRLVGVGWPLLRHRAAAHRAGPPARAPRRRPAARPADRTRRSRERGWWSRLRRARSPSSRSGKHTKQSIVSSPQSTKPPSKILRTTEDFPSCSPPTAALGRFAFPLLDRYRWLYVPADRLPEYAQRLRDLGVGPGHVRVPQCVGRSRQVRWSLHSARQDRARRWMDDRHPRPVHATERMSRH